MWAWGRPYGLAAAAVVALVVAFVVGGFALFIAASELTADREHPHPDELYRVALRPGLALQTSDFWAQTPRELAPAARFRTQDVAAAIRLDGESATVGLPGSDRPPQALRMAVVDADFPSVFRVTSRGRPLKAVERDGGIWLTRTAWRRVTGGGAGAGGRVLYNDRPRIVEGLIDDPPAGSHLQYDGLAPWDERRPGYATLGVTFPAYTYVRVRGDPEGARRGLEQLLRELSGQDWQVRLVPVSSLRRSPPLLGEVFLAEVGRAVELRTALMLAGVGFAGALLVTVLLALTWLERRRETLGLSVCLGRSPGSVQLQLLGAAAAAQAVSGALAAVVLVVSGASLQRFVQQGSAATAAWAQLALTVAAVALAVLLLTAVATAWLRFASPLQFVRPAQGRSRRTTWLVGCGIAGIMAVTVTLAFAAALFFSERSAGMAIAGDQARIWSVRVDDVDAAALAARLSRLADVERVERLDWRPFLELSGNRTVSMDAQAELHSATVLTGSASWPDLLGDRPLAGSWPRGGGACEAAVDRRFLTEILGEQPPSHAIGRRVRLHGLGGGQECRITAVGSNLRIDRLDVSAGPVVHLVGLEGDRTTNAAFVTAKVRARPAPSAYGALLRAQCVRACEPMSVAQLAARAYERETRIGLLLSVAAGALAAMCAGTSMALTAYAMERQASEIALRTALGAGAWELAAFSTRPWLVALGGGFAAALLVNLIFSGFWSAWGGLTGRYALGPAIIGSAVAIAPCVATVVLALGRLRFGGLEAVRRIMARGF